MARNTKPKKSPSALKKSRGGTLIGMFIGLVLGVALAAGVVLYLNQSPMPFTTKTPPPRTETAQANGGNGKQTPQPLSLPGKPGDPAPEKRFQFYDILPGKANAVPDAKPTDAEAKKEEAKKEEPKKEEPKEAKKEEPKPLFLQAGSFSDAADADNLKASLALMGMEASVQQVMVQDKTYYRVRLGPYARVEDINKARSELAKAGVDATLVKKEP